MSLQNDIDLANIISGGLDLFTWTNDTSANFRCPVCGDSEKSETKKRAWLYAPNDADCLSFSCFNCSTNMSFKKFLKTYFPNEYSQHAVNSFVNTSASIISSKKKKQVTPVNTQKDERGFICLDKLEPAHRARKYFSNRKIPKKWLSHLWYTDCYPKTNDKRIVFKLYSDTGLLIGYEGRRIEENNTPKYFTHKILKDHHAVFGMDNINHNKPVWVTEGIIDSLFIPNSISVLCSSLEQRSISLGLNKRNTILLFDNDNYNKFIIKNIKRAILNGWSIACWQKSPEQLNGASDINDIIIEYGKMPDGVLDIRTDLSALMWLESWRKI